MDNDKWDDYMDLEIDKLIKNAIKELVFNQAIEILENFDIDIVEDNDYDGHRGATRDVLDVKLDRERKLISIKLEPTNDSEQAKEKLRIAQDNIEYVLENYCRA